VCSNPAKRATFRNHSARRPASTESRLPGVLCRLRWVASAFLRRAFGLEPTQRAVETVRIRNDAGPQHFCHYRGVLRVGAGIRAGLSGSGDRSFSSGSILALPDHRASFVLRDAGHIKGQFWIGCRLPMDEARPPNNDAGGDSLREERSAVN